MCKMIVNLETDVVIIIGFNVNEKAHQIDISLLLIKNCTRMDAGIKK